MDSIVSSIVTPVVQSLLLPIKRHLGYMISTTKHVANMLTQMGELNDTKSDVEDRKKRNESNNLKVPARVPGWLEEVGDIEAKVKRIDSANVGSCFNLKARHKLGRKASNIIMEINRLMGEKSNIDWTDIPIPLAQVNSTSTPVSDYTDFKSRDSVYEEAFKKLKPGNKPHMMALCGMGGVGKTTMMEKLHKVVRENKMFDFVIKVAIGDKMDVSMIQKAVAEQLAIELNESTKEARVGKLHNAFKKKSDDGKNKFLVILDDIWQSVDLKDIGLSPKPDKGIDFKVLLTSRDRNVCIQMGAEPDSILNLEIIEDSEAQDFFLQFANISDDTDLRNIGRDITIRCHGLPIAIKTIALTLKGQIKDVWEDTLSKLKHKGVYEVTTEIFAISYKHLHDEETRLTLLLCGLFPEDFNTPREDLVRYSYGLKLFKGVNTIRETRSRLNTCIERLIHANLLIRSQKVGCVKMHDLVHVFVLDVSSKSEHLTIVGNMSEWPGEPMSEFCKKISLTCEGMHNIPTSPKHPNLSLLKLMHGNESLRFSENFYKEMKNLEVLAYNNMEYPLNLRSLQCSSNLRTLCLHGCSLMSDCSSIGNLSNLEVLSLAYSIMYKLPSTIEKLEKLKLLDLTCCRHPCIDDGIFKSLVNLKELYMRGVRRKVNAEDDELVACVENLDALEIELFDKNVLPRNMSFKNLKRFRISLGCHLYKFYGLSTYSFENTLMLVTNEGEQLLDSRMNKLFEKTKVLYLQLNGINDLVDRLGASLHNLIALHIDVCTNLKYLFTIGVANGLKHLEHLRIDKCFVLETLVDSHEIYEAKAIRFPSLKFLYLTKLPMLMSLCKGGNVIELPQLEELELESLPNFTSIYQLFLKKEVMNSKLKRLEIDNMEKLKEIWPSQLSDNDQVTSQLRVIKVKNCDSLVNLFPSNPMSLLHHLEQLTVEGCGSIDVIFNPLSNNDQVMSQLSNNDQVMSQLRVIEVSRCKSLVNLFPDNPISLLHRLEKLTVAYCDSIEVIFNPLSNNDQVMSQLRVIEVKYCNSLVNLFPSNPMSLLHRLEELRVENCGSIDVIFIIDLGSSCVAKINQGSSNLRSVEVRRCKKLKEVWRVKGVSNDLHILGFQAVEYISIKECKRLRNVFTPTTSNFYMKSLTEIILIGHVLKEETESDETEMGESSQVKETNVISNKDKSKVVDDALNVVAFPSYLRRTCRNVQKLIISDFKRVEAVFEIESSNLTTTLNNQQPLLPYLKDLYLSYMERMTHVWKYDRKQCLIYTQEPISSSFLNLTTINLFICDRIKYLFSPLMAKLLSNLNSITITYCDAFEEVVSNIDDEYEETASSMFSHTNTTFFPHLDILHLKRLKSLKRIEGVAANRLGSVDDTPVHDKLQCSQVDVAYSSFCRYLRTIEIEYCDALLNVIPSHAVGQMAKLEELKISYCESLREIFEIEGVNEDVVGDITDIGKGNGDMGPAMTKIQRSTMITSLELHNLKVLHIEGCHGLKYIFTSSTLESLEKLQELKIVSCSALQVIVKQEDDGLIASKDVVFPRLKSLTLGCLRNLKGFFLGENKFRWPSLDKVEIYGCPQMMIFTSGASEALNLKYIHTGVGKHCLECGLNFDWTNNPPHENPQSRFPWFDRITDFLQFPWSFSNLIELDLRNMVWIKTIFPSNKLVKEENVEQPRDIEEAVADDDDDDDVVIPNSKKKQQLMSMDPQTSSHSTWKKNHWWTCTHLSNLTKLSLERCNDLEDVFSYRVAATLVQLQDLHISHCYKLKVVVEQVQDFKTKANELVSFPCLKSIQLTYLSKLKGFCLGSDLAFEWPSLHTLEITYCPEMTIFTNGRSTTPKLEVVKTMTGLREATEDLNSFIRTKLREYELTFGEVHVPHEYEF